MESIQEKQKNYFDLLSKSLSPLGLTHRYAGYENLDYVIDVVSHQITKIIPVNFLGMDLPFHKKINVGEIVSEPTFQRNAHSSSINFYHLRYDGLKVILKDETLTPYIPVLKSKLEEELGEEVEISLKI